VPVGGIVSKLRGPSYYGRRKPSFRITGYAEVVLILDLPLLRLADKPGASWNKADFPGSCVRFGDSVRLPQADQVAFGPRKGLNLPAASNSIAFFLSARGPPTNLKEGVS